MLCPFPWCEDELQLKLSNIFTRLQIVSRTKERSQLTGYTVNMTEIFKSHPECHNPRVVLIEGNPGMGKTTYCQKLAHDWSVGKIPPDASFPMIQGKIFSNTFLVLTARHEAGRRLRRYCDTLLEIIGYTNDDVDSYIKKYFSKHEDQSLAEKMIQQLKINKELRELTANPLNTALLCLLCEETKGIFPSSRTKLYDDLVSCALRRYFSKRGVPLSDDDPLERCSDQLNQLGETAFEALLKNQLYFSRDESTDFLQLPFLSREPSVSKIRPRPCYAFTHKTFQEYFAAFYLAQQTITGNKGEAKSLLAQLSPVDNWQVWEFLLTMVLRKRSEMAVFVVSRLCAFFYQERPRNKIKPSVDSWDFEACEGEIEDWTVNMYRLSEDEQVLEDVVTKTLEIIVNCEEGENKLDDNQRKMVHVLARCFPVRKLNFFVSRPDFIVYSEYLKANCTLTNLLLRSDEADELLLATVREALHHEQNLKHLTLECVNFEYMLINSNLDMRDLCPDSPPGRQPSYSDIENISKRQSWMVDVRSKELACLLKLYHRLTRLNLKGVMLGCKGTAVLAEVFHANRNLTHLSLFNASISDLGAMCIANALRSNCSLTHLSLRANYISVVGASWLANSLKQNCTLQYLDLSDNDDSDPLAVELASALESNSSLTHLALSHICPGDKRSTVSVDSDKISLTTVPCRLISAFGASKLARALLLNRTLTFLDLSFNEIREAGAAALGEALPRNCSLSHLYLSANGIGDSGTASLGEGLKSNCTLTRLYLSENRIRDPGAEALGKAMQSNHNLTHLHLHTNYIGDLGAAALARALESTVIHTNYIGDLGAAALARALESTVIQLTHLDLTFNKISCVGAEAFAKALGSNSSLKALELGSNAIGSSGASSFGKALRSNRTLTHLIVSGNNITESGAVELVDALLINNSLICLNAEGNPISSLEAENLKRDIQSHCVIFM